MNKIPVYLLNGALGSGKTTLLRELLQKNAKKQFVIENEIANTSVDDAVLQDDETESDTHTIAGECVCCSDGSSLLKALVAAKEGQYETVFIESTGAASMAKLLISVLGEAYFTDNFEIRQAIYVLDALAYQRKKPTAHDVAVADSVVVSKLDILFGAERSDLKELLQSNITKPLIFKDETADIYSTLTDYSQSTQNLREVIRAGLPKELHQPATIVLSNTKPVDTDALTARVQELGIERVKGFLQTAKESVRYEATADHTEVNAYDGETSQHYLVVIDSDKQKVNTARDALKELVC